MLAHEGCSNNEIERIFWQVGMDVVLENGDTVVHIGAEARVGEEN